MLSPLKGVIIAIVIIGSLIISWLDGGGFGEAGSFSKYLFDRSHEMLATAPILTPLSDQLPKYSQPTVPRHLASLQLGVAPDFRDKLDQVRHIFGPRGLCTGGVEVTWRGRRVGVNHAKMNYLVSVPSKYLASTVRCYRCYWSQLFGVAAAN